MKYVPPEVKRFSWGAFWLVVPWAVAHRVWIGLLAMIPVVNVVMMIWLGFKGREMAWERARNITLEQFQRRQHYWNIGAWIIVVAIFAYATGQATVEPTMEVGIAADSTEAQEQIPLDENEGLDEVQPDGDQHYATEEAQAVQNGYPFAIDCESTSQVVEQLICSDPDLLSLEAELATNYQASMGYYADENLLRQDHLLWLMERNSCKDIQCLQQVYQVRITMLASEFEGDTEL